MTVSFAFDSHAILSVRVGKRHPAGLHSESAAISYTQTNRSIMKLGIGVVFCGLACAQQAAHQHPQPAPAVPLQPLAQHVRRLEDALNYLGQPLSASEHRRINAAI